MFDPILFLTLSYVWPYAVFDRSHKIFFSYAVWKLSKSPLYGNVKRTTIKFSLWSQNAETSLSVFIEYFAVDVFTNPDPVFFTWTCFVEFITRIGWKVFLPALLYKENSCCRITLTDKLNPLDKNVKFVILDIFHLFYTDRTFKSQKRKKRPFKIPFK